VAIGKAPQSPKQTNAGVSASAGDIHVKSQDGTTFKIGSVSDTLLDLKERIEAACNIPKCQQRLFVKKGQAEDQALDEDWRTLRSYGVKKGDALNLIVREPWQRTDVTNKSAVHLMLPEACASVFEMVLDYMYDERARRECSSMAVDLTPERALGMLWLAGRLEMAGLQAQLVQHLERAVTPANAHLYLSAALELGLSKVGEAASRLTAAALDSLPRGACDAMPLDAVERLLAMAAAATPSTSASGVVGAMGATAAGRDRVLASYLRARDAAGRLDEESYRRLMHRHSAAGGGGGGSSADAEAEDDDGGDEGEVEAEDVLLLLDLALRFGDAGL
jgi:hypothetical protein